MRKILTLVMFAGTVGTLMAQTPTPDARRDNRRFAAERIEITGAQQDAAGTLRMTGLVIVLEDGTRVTADAGTLNIDGQTMELSGNVRLTFARPTPLR